MGKRSWLSQLLNDEILPAIAAPNDQSVPLDTSPLKAILRSGSRNHFPNVDLFHPKKLETEGFIFL